MVIAVDVAVENDLFANGVHGGDLPQQHLHVLMRAHHSNSKDQSGGHLIRQGLEQVVVALVNQGDAQMALARALEACTPAKPPPTMTTCGA